MFRHTLTCPKPQGEPSALHFTVEMKMLCIFHEDFIMMEWKQSVVGFPMEHSIKDDCISNLGRRGAWN